MRLLAAVLVVTAGVAHAESSWSEYSAAEPLRRAEQLTEAACDMTVDLRGAIADVSVVQRLTNPGPAALAATTEVELPPGAQLYSLALHRGGAKTATGAALAIPEPVATEKVTAVNVLGADHALLRALPARDGRPRYRLIVQPIDPDREVSIVTRWTVAAAIRDGAIKLLLPGRGDTKQTCRVTLQATPGPGATIDRLQLAGTDIGSRGTATFDLGASDAMVSVLLAFKKRDPLVWTQTTTLGEGHSAQAITIATPPIRSTTARRAVLVIDGSRSMELVGRHNVQKLVRAIGGALPPKSELEAIVFDRKATRVLGAWKPATAETLTAIETAITKHTATNGSDTAAALTAARQLVVGSREQAMIILITDGVLGEIDTSTLHAALGGDAKALDLHAIALAPGRMTAPEADLLRAAIDRVGGSYIEVPARDVDTALADLDQWLRPAWLGLALEGSELKIPDQLRAGTGIVLTQVVRKPGKLKLRGRGDAAFTVAAGTLAAGPVAALAMAVATTDEIEADVHAKLRALHPVVDDQRSLAVLATAGKVAANRRAMVAGGGPYTRMVDVADPTFPIDANPTPVAQLGGSAIDRTTLQLLFRAHLQPAAFACYQKALAQNGSLAGTALFKLEIGRGELTRAEVGGLGDATFDACLLDAAYAVTPPLPNPDFNVDDRTLVNYPLTFTVKEHKPFVLAGDADSSQPLDIDAIQGGVPASARRRPVKAVDPSTPLGNLRPPPTK